MKLTNRPTTNKQTKNSPARSTIIMTVIYQQTKQKLLVWNRSKIKKKRLLLFCRCCFCFCFLNKKAKSIHSSLSILISSSHKRHNLHFTESYRSVTGECQRRRSLRGAMTKVEADGVRVIVQRDEGFCDL